MNNFQVVNRNYQYLIDRIGGRRLFYFLVESTNFSLKIIEQMRNLNLPGKAIFFPLDRIRFRQKNIDDENIVNVLNMLIYDEKYDDAIKYVFFFIY